MRRSHRGWRGCWFTMRWPRWPACRRPIRRHGFRRRTNAVKREQPIPSGGTATCCGCARNPLRWHRTNGSSDGNATHAGSSKHQRDFGCAGDVRCWRRRRRWCWRWGSAERARDARHRQVLRRRSVGRRRAGGTVDGTAHASAVPFGAGGVAWDGWWRRFEATGFRSSRCGTANSTSRRSRCGRVIKRGCCCKCAGSSARGVLVLLVGRFGRLPVMRWTKCSSARGVLVLLVGGRAEVTRGRPMRWGAGRGIVLAGRRARVGAPCWPGCRASDTIA